MTIVNPNQAPSIRRNVPYARIWQQSEIISDHGYLPSIPTRCMLSEPLGTEMSFGPTNLVVRELDTEVGNGRGSSSPVSGDLVHCIYAAERQEQPNYCRD